MYWLGLGLMRNRIATIYRLSMGTKVEPNTFSSNEFVELWWCSAFTSILIFSISIPYSFAWKLKTQTIGNNNKSRAVVIRKAFHMNVICVESYNYKFNFLRHKVWKQKQQSLTTYKIKMNHIAFDRINNAIFDDDFNEERNNNNIHHSRMYLQKRK